MDSPRLKSPEAIFLMISMWILVFHLMTMIRCFLNIENLWKANSILQLRKQFQRRKIEASNYIIFVEVTFGLTIIGIIVTPQWWFNPKAVAIGNFKWCNVNYKKFATFEAFWEHLSAFKFLLKIINEDFRQFSWKFVFTIS